MGNLLSGAVPSLILPIETYLSDLHEFHFQSSLGSTRFLKVVKVLNSEGPCVLKIFVINDPTLPLKPYLEQVEDVKTRLSDAPNCLPYQRTMLSEKAAIVVRQFGKDNLYDRLSTRPFLSDMEKRWLAFQLLKALEQCHLAKVCHGDIKSQNVLVSSWNWLWLTDFATFKPSTLPYDNPADFSYYFDSSRRRTCYIAPERFTSAQDAPSTNFLLGEDRVGAMNQLTHAMDIFSAGCVLAELFTDGTAPPPFDFSQLLAFREKRYYPDKTLSAIGDKSIRDMIASMIALEPAKRFSASQYLDKYREVVFPEVFYNFLWPYAYSFAAQRPLLSADCKIQKLENELGVILEPLKAANDKAVSSTKLHPTYLIIVAFVTSLSRSIKYCENKLKALRLLNTLASYSESGVVLDRILPYLLYSLHDPYPRVRAEAVHTVAHVLSLVDILPKSDLRIFSEYVLPSLQHVVNDSCSLVRLALAEQVSLLAETANRYLEYASTHIEDDPHVQLGAESSGSPKLDYGREARLVQESFHEMLVTLLCDSENAVRRGLVHNGLAKLCVFFGKQKSSDVLLSHMITFLNDKNDWRLRSTFYDCCPALAAFIGWQSSTIILKPLLQQGLRDSEEIVVFKTLSCLATLTRAGLIQKPTIYELLQDAVPFLSHPNGAVRIGSVDLFCSAARFLNLADVHCKVMPMISSYLKQALIKLDREHVVYKALKDPIPRQIWDMVVHAPQLLELLDFLKEKQWRLGAVTSNTAICGSTFPDDAHLAGFYQKLLNQGLTDEHEERLVAFADILLKMRKMKSGFEQQPPSSPSVNTQQYAAIRKPGMLDLARLTIVTKYADLTLDRGRRAFSTQDRRYGGGAQSMADIVMNEEWQHMFGGAAGLDDALMPEPDAVSTVSSEQTLVVTATAHAEHGTAFTAEPTTSAKSAQAASTSEAHPPSGAVSLDRLSLTTTTSSTISSEIDILGVGGSLQEGKKREPPVGNTGDNFGSASMSGNNDMMIDTSSATETNVRMSDCRISLTKFVEVKREEWRRSSRAASCRAGGSSTVASVSHWPAPSWKPSGFLLAHTHEHRAAINRLSCHPNGRFMASASSDGTLKLWDCQKMEGRSMANRSRYTYNKIGGKIKCVVCLSDQVVCTSDNGLIQILRLDSNWSKPTLLRQYQTELENEGALVDMAAYFDGSTNVIVGASHHGHVICWDQRQPNPVWRFRNPSRFGLVTSLTVDADQYQWACVGTAAGRLVLWDLRFQLSINVCQHPAEKPIYRLWTHPLEHSRVLVSVGGGRGELSEWDLETGTRQATIWPCVNTPLLSYPRAEEEDSAPSSYSTTSACTYPGSDGRSLLVLTGDSEGGIRYWDMCDVKNSCVLSSVDEEHQSQARSLPNQQQTRALSYRRQVVDGVQVYFTESASSTATASPRWSSRHSTMSKGTSATGLSSAAPSEFSKGSSLDVQVTTSHHDIVSDMAVCRTGPMQWLLATASRDGVIKVWK